MRLLFLSFSSTRLALHRRTALLLAAIALAFGVVTQAAAHSGDDAEVATVAAAQPRAEAHSDAFEVVAVLGPGGVLTIWLDRWRDNSPVDGSVVLTLEGQEVPAERQGIGLAEGQASHHRGAALMLPQLPAGAHEMIGDITLAATVTFWLNQ